MPSEAFSEAFLYARERTARYEGGWVNDPDDRGGATMWGASTPYARRKGWRGPMRDLPKGMVDRWFEADFWTRPRLEEIAAVDREIAAYLYDMAVNHGRWALIVQHAVRARRYVAIDGVWGPQTRNVTVFVARQTPANLLGALKVERGRYYHALVYGDERFGVKGDLSQSKFLWGWLKRCA